MIGIAALRLCIHASTLLFRPTPHGLPMQVLQWLLPDWVPSKWLMLFTQVRLRQA